MARFFSTFWAGLGQRRRWLALGSAVAAILAGLVVFLASARKAPEPPVERVGRLITGQPKAGDEARLHEDLELVRGSLRGTARELFDLAVALRGLGQGGLEQGSRTPDVPRARAICERRRWTRCQSGEMLFSAWVPVRPADTGAEMLDGALEDLVWKLGSAEEVREVLRPSKVPPSASEATKSIAVRTRLRLAAVAETPDAQAALLSELCAIRPAGCDQFPRQLEGVARERADGHPLPPPGHP